MPVTEDEHAESASREFQLGFDVKLGALVYKSKKPACMDCTIRDFCQAYTRNLQNVLPIYKKRNATPRKICVCGILLGDEGRILIVQRPSKGLLELL
jgi:A/G-specific adenine glycosylase